MKINVAGHIELYNGEMLREGDPKNGKLVELRVILCNALMFDDKEKDLMVKLRRNMLATTCVKNDEVELHADNVVMLMKLVNESYGTLIAGPVLALLDPVKAAQAEKDGVSKTAEA